MHLMFTVFHNESYSHGISIVLHKNLISIVLYYESYINCALDLESKKDFLFTTVRFFATENQAKRSN